MSRVDQLVRSLNLQPHPEGGWYAEVFRSHDVVRPADGRGSRSALTAIYFLLERGQVSRLHRVTSDEAWHFVEGDPLQLTICEEGFRAVGAITLGGLGGSSQPLHVVPAGWWQAAECLGDYSLVSCTVGPGFDFADFALLDDRVDLRAGFERLHPELRRLI